MKYYYLLPVAGLLSLSACSTHLSKQDHDMLADTRNMAKDADDKANQALEEAKQARASADQASTRADRIFRESQRK